MPEMGDAGFVTGVVFGAATALAFLLACLYSAYKAIVDRRRIIVKNENIRTQRMEEAAEMAAEDDALQNAHTAANGTAGASTSPAAATSAHSLAAGAQEERRPSAAFKPPPPPPEKQWDQEGVHYRSEGGVMHIHKSDSSKLSVGPGDVAEKEPLMSAPDAEDAGASSEDNADDEEEEAAPAAEETAETDAGAEDTPEAPTEDAAASDEPAPEDPATTEATTTTTTTTESSTSETAAQVHVTVSVSENQDGQVISSTSSEALKLLESSNTAEGGASAGSTKVHKLFTSSSADGTRTQTGTDLPDVTNGDPASWV